MIDLFRDGIRKIIRFGFMAQTIPAPVGHGMANSNFEFGPATSAVNGSAVTNTTAAVQDTLYALPLVTPQRGGVLRKLTVNTGSGGNNIRFGLYENVAKNQLDPYPGQLLFDSGTITMATGDNEVLCNIPVEPLRIYWGVFNCAVTINLQGLQPYGATASLGIAEAEATAMNRAIEKASAFGALPDPFPAGGSWSTLAVSLLMKTRYGP